MATRRAGGADPGVTVLYLQLPKGRPFLNGQLQRYDFGQSDAMLVMAVHSMSPTKRTAFLRSFARDGYSLRPLTARERYRLARHRRQDQFPLWQRIVGGLFRLRYLPLVLLFRMVGRGGRLYVVESSA